MTFSHIESLAVAMPCHACHKYADQGMHQGTDGRWYHPVCCPQCRPAEPLPERDVGTLEGEQESLFEGGDDAL